MFLFLEGGTLPFRAMLDLGSVTAGATAGRTSAAYNAFLTPKKRECDNPVNTGGLPGATLYLTLHEQGRNYGSFEPDRAHQRAQLGKGLP